MPSDTMPPSSKPLIGAALIADYVKHLPPRPGVYRMMADDGELLYVGKARSLKSRVSNYTTLNGHSNRIARMISETRSMEFVVTETETESLLLEANLIKSLKPRYNVLMRDDKSFANILLATDHPVPQITKHRGAQKRPGHYFGPFASAGAVNRTLNTLQKAFLLRSCTDSVYESRTRPCLLHQIKRCSAPCTGEVSEAGYGELVAEAMAFLNGRNRDIQTLLSKQMEEASIALDFERAASLRDRIRALTYIQESQGINPGSVDEADLFAVHADGGQACIQVFFFRAGQNLGAHAFFPKHDRELPTAQILSSFIAQFYDNRMPPRQILLSEGLEDEELLAEALGIKAGRKVTILAPQRGEKRELAEHALMNAREALGRRLSDTASQMQLLRALGDQLGLTAPPRRIEVYDNSHTGGTNALGGMIVATEEGFRKNQYRKFNIKDTSLTPGDDFGMMREVLDRRFARLMKEETPSSDNWPSLIVIDGGAGQLSVAKQAMEDAGITIGPDTENGEIMLLSVAKGRREDERGQRRADRTAAATGEQFFIPGRAPFMLPPRSPVLYYLQRLRDEAHRFAIGSHRAKRSKAMVANPLDGIDGIGAKRKKALLHHYGSAKAVSRANAYDLSQVEGISEELAQRIYDFFHPTG
ncbi:excinuclease ABC subunit UvrC [Parvularcula sp. LCG005]|uniref:excinuclease ABC subunit UvrC n=1 Tax=Parvularcula sp. LCG005 TaxID=3078805 RepID=UPI002942A8E5|nr:excinuclease ABC subunit UvrC [Parvularcula sp. LCG005]WOI54261.1 excinuclease ABC subunit UvrC [Parvularcula sp. LCG005]